MRLIVNGFDIDLYQKSVIAQTKQANDLNNIATRQASYTNKFKVPATANNVRAFDNMGLVGNNSNVPYRKNSCYLFGDTGECFVRNGWAIITDASGDYEVTIYDGIIDLYKSIENKNLSSLDLSELDHIKNVDNVIATWVVGNTLPYRYILADYNGKTGDTESGQVNIDYLLPSVKVSYLWDKIFAENGFTYSGGVFLTQYFKNLWLTYPKGITQEELNVTLFDSSDYVFVGTASSNYRYGIFTESDINLLPSTPSNTHLKVAETGLYKITVSGNIRLISVFGVELPCVFYVGKNGEGLPASSVPYVTAGVYEYGADINIESFVNLNANESLCVYIGLDYSSWIVEDSDIHVTLYKSDNPFELGDAFSDLSIREFMTEIIQRFGLTIFTSKENPLNYEFRTMQEVLQDTEYVDWSNKFSRSTGEAYMIGSYAQQNWLRYKYNDDESTHNDGFIAIDNVNLPDSKELIKSKIYSPEKDPVTFLGRATNVYKLWDKEPNTGEDADTNPYSFKPLDKRYYLMRADRINSGVTVTSETLGTASSASGYYIENFFNLGFNDIVGQYYAPIEQIFDKVQVLTCELWLKEADIANLDFRKLYYIKQLGNYYLLNKVSNYIPGEITKAEMIRVRYSLPEPPAKELVMTDLDGEGGLLTATFTINYTVPTLMMQHSNDYGITWVSSAGSATSPRTKSGLPTGVVYYVRMYDPINNIPSNYLSVVLNP